MKYFNFFDPRIETDKSSAFIYTLSHPLTGEIRYVGKTSVTPRKRYHRHMYDGAKRTSSHRGAWIKGLLNQGLEPVFEILDIVPEQEWPFWEQYWIAQMRAWNIRLVNIGNGGEGVTKGSKRPGIVTNTKPNSKSFKKGMRAGMATEIKKGQRLSPATEFKQGGIPFNAKPIFQYDTNGQFLNEYSSLLIAYKAVKMSPASIRKSADKNVPVGRKIKYLWKWEKT